MTEVRIIHDKEDLGQAVTDVQHRALGVLGLPDQDRLARSTVLRPGARTRQGAVAFAAFNAALNEHENITCMHGDLFAPVAGARFDLILANPPFVVSPDSTFLYRDSRGICERIAREAPSFLAAGGILQMVCNWPCHRGRDWKDDLSAWFRKSGCDVWVLQTDHLAPASYAGIWLGQAHDDSADLGPELERWMAFYDEAGIEAVGGGVVAMRRRAPRGLDTRPWFEIRDMPPANGPSGETIARVLEARATLARLDDEALLDARVALAPDARAFVIQRPSTSGWERESSELRLTRGLAMAVRLDPAGGPDARGAGAPAAADRDGAGGRTSHRRFGPELTCRPRSASRANGRSPDRLGVGGRHARAPSGLTGGIG